MNDGNINKTKMQNSSFMKINQNIGATVIISSTRVIKQVSFIDGSNENSNKKNLREFGQNFNFNHRLKTIITNQMMFEREPTLEFPDMPKSSVLLHLEAFMSKPHRQGFLLIISGDGIEDRKDNYKIKFVISQISKEEFILLTLDEIIEAWDHRKNKQTNKHFLLIADFCQADAWVEQIKKLNRSDITIQASFLIEASSVSTIDYGSMFLKHWLLTNYKKKDHELNPPDIKIGAINPKFEDAKPGQFWGNSELIQEIFGLKVGSEYWKTPEKFQKKQAQTIYYIGQLIKDPNSDSTDLIAHGFGSTWSEKNELISFGIFQNGALIQQYKGYAFGEEKTSQGMKSLKVDANGNLLYGVFKNGYLEGNGIFATPLRGRWDGKFVKGQFSGLFDFVNQAGWIFLVTASDECYSEVHKITDPDGKTINFQLKKNKPNGKMWVVDEYCNLYQGDFADGKISGKGKILTCLGYAIRAIFKNDLIIEIKNASYLGRPIEIELMGGKISEGFLGKVVSAKAVSKNLDESLTWFDKIKSLQIITPLFKENQSWIDALGNFFFGTLKNGVKDGFGIQVTMNGNHYEGDFVNGKREGKGKIIYANGNLYEGDFKNDKRNGVGRLAMTNGDFYEAEFSNGNLEGRCKLLFSSGNFYEGHFFNGHFEGSGRYVFQNGDFYEGDFKNGNFDGNGILVQTDGKIYDGRFRYDAFDGKGKLKFPNGDVYDGDFKFGLFHGTGKFSSAKGDLFEGKYLNGQKNGKGIIKYFNGDVYEGEFRGDKFEGPGVYRFSNGNVYQGQFIAGKPSENEQLKPANANLKVEKTENEKLKKKTCLIF